MIHRSQHFHGRIGILILFITALFLLSCPIPEPDPTPDPVPTAPDAPENLRATARDTAVVLTWDMVADAASYRIYRNGAATPLKTDDPITDTTHTDADLANGTEYTYTVRSVGSNGAESPHSTEATATPGTPPAIPGNLMFTIVAGEVILTWNEVTGATYRVYRNGAARSLAPDLNENTYTDRTVVGGTAYRYIVRAVGTNKVEGDSSNEVTATSPLPPKNLRATPGDREVVLTWEPVVGARGYNIYRNSRVITSDISELTYSDSDPSRPLTNGRSYTYTVRSGPLETVEGADSMEVTVVLPIPTPGNLMFTIPAGEVILTWTAVNDAARYRVYRNGSPIDTTTPITANTYPDSTVVGGTTYRYTVRAVGTNDVESDSSDEVTATPLSAPGNLVATPGDGVVMLTWNAVTGATGYDIYRDSMRITANVGELNYTDGLDTPLTNDTEYTYTVRARTSDTNVSADSMAMPATPRR